MKTYSKNISLHNFKIRLSCNDLSVFKCLTGQLQFPEFRKYPDYINIKINIDVKYIANEGLRSDVFDTSKNNFSFNCWMKDIDIRIDKRTNSIYVTLLWPSVLENEALLHLIVIEPLRYILKLRGVFLMHSAALAKDTKGLIICGGPSEGKSTLACALLARGYEFLSDEFSILNKGRIYSFPLKIRLDKFDSTGIKDLMSAARCTGRTKSSTSELSPKRNLESFQPNLTIFLYKARASAKRVNLRPLCPEESFFFLVSDKNNCLVYEKNPLLRKKQLQALSYIAQNTRSYLLIYGLNRLNRACQIIDGLL